MTVSVDGVDRVGADCADAQRWGNVVRCKCEWQGARISSCRSGYERVAWRLDNGEYEERKVDDSGRRRIGSVGRREAEWGDTVVGARK
jgi:hypothetical protein